MRALGSEAVARKENEDVSSTKQPNKERLWTPELISIQSPKRVVKIHSFDHHVIGEPSTMLLQNPPHLALAGLDAFAEGELDAGAV